MVSTTIGQAQWGRAITPTVGLRITDHANFVHAFLITAITVISAPNASFTGGGAELSISASVMTLNIAEETRITDTLARIRILTIIVPNTGNAREITESFQAYGGRPSTALVRTDLAQLAGVIDTLLASAIPIDQTRDTFSII